LAEVISAWRFHSIRSRTAAKSDRPRTVFIFGAEIFLPMKHHFKKHYTLDEANALLPQIRKWLVQLNQLREDLQRCEKRLSGLTEQGNDIGGETVNNWIRALAGMQETLAEFQRREIFIKDLERGLLDFPAFIGGKEVFLCWESDEDAVEFWHDLETGFGGRERL
jgi:hypothetical protein